MVEAQEYKGHWWLPDKEDKMVSGVLKYTPGGSIELELIGDFFDFSESFLNDDRVPVIYGLDSDGKDISLFDCGHSFNLVFKAGFPIAKYHPRYIAVGIHCLSINEKLFNKAKVRIPELSYWLYPDTVKRDYYSDEEGITGVGVKMARSSEVVRTQDITSLKNGVKISLVKDANYTGDEFLFSTQFEQFTSLVVDCTKEVSIKYLYEKVIRFEKFLSLATLRNVSFAEMMIFSKKDLTATGKRKHTAIRIDSVFHSAPSNEKIINHDFLFNYFSIESKYKEIIRKWYSRDSKFDAIRNHFLDFIDYSGQFTYINFLVVIQALEGYGVRYRKDSIEMETKERIKKASNDGKPFGKKDITLRDILSTLLKDYKDISCINKRINKSAVVDSRHYYSHLTEKQKKHKLDGVKLFELTCHLRKLLLCCVLSYLGFNNAEIEQLTKDSHSAIVQLYR